MAGESEEEDEQQQALLEQQAQMQQMFAMMQGQGLNGNYGLPGMDGPRFENESEEEYISASEFNEGLTDQETTIFNALVISINQLHMQRQKNFQKRRQKYLEKFGQSENNFVNSGQSLQNAQAMYQNQLMALGLNPNLIQGLNGALDGQNPLLQDEMQAREGQAALNQAETHGNTK